MPPDHHDHKEQPLRSGSPENGQAHLPPGERAEGDSIAEKEALERKFPELAQEIFRATLSSIGDAVITTDTEGKISLLNPIAEALTGWKSAEAIGQPVEKVFRVMREGTRNPAPNPVTAVLRESAAAGVANHNILIALDGKETALEERAAAVRDANGKICGAVLVFRDVSRQRRSELALREFDERASNVLEARKESEDRLRRSEEELHALANSIPQLVWMAQPDGNIFWYNQRWYEYTGTTLEQMAGWGWQSVHDPKILPEVMERWIACIQDGVPFDMEFPLLGADKKFRWFLTRITPIRDEQGKLTRWFGTNTNVDEQRQLLDSLKEARDHLEKRVLERTAELHAANENLRQLSAEVLQTRDDEQRRLARELHDSVGQLLAGIAMNITVVQSETQKLSPAVAKCVADNARLLDEVTREIRTMSYLLHPPLLDEAGLGAALNWYAEGFAERSQIKVELELPADLSRLPGDMEIAIFRIIQQCLTNIHRHSGSATAVIRIYRQGQQLIVEVIDHGKGIAKEKIREITDSGRTGVGFAGMRERLRPLGGTLQVESDSKGTLVRATLKVE